MRNFNMKMKKCLALSLICIAAAGCADQQKKQAAAAPAPAPTPTAAQQAQTQLTSDRDAYVAQTQARIDEMTRFANQLEQQSTKVDKVKGKKMENESRDLTSLLNDTKRDLDQVKSAAPENWIDQKRDVDADLGRAESQYSNSVHLLQ